MAEEKTTFGATILGKQENTPEIRTELSPSPEPPSRCSTPPSCLRTQTNPDGSATPRKELTPRELEGGLGGGLSQTSTAANSSSARINRVSVDGRVKECTAWPSKQSLKQKAKAAKNKRQFCPWWSAMNKKQKVIAKVFIALLIIAIAAGVGVGISRAVGGGVWTSDGQSSDIPSN